jgi:hypothetical protein
MNENKYASIHQCWRAISLKTLLNGVQEAAGSNPAGPRSVKALRTSFFFRHCEWKEEVKQRLRHKLHLCHCNKHVDPELHESEGNDVESFCFTSALT